MDLLLQLVVNGVVQGSLYALFALSFNLILSTTRVFHLAHGGAYLAAAYAIYWATNKLQWPVGAAFIAGAMAACALGCLCEIAVYRYMRNRFGIPNAVTIASLGLLILIANLFRAGFGSGAVLVPTPTMGEGINVGSAFLPVLGLWTIATTLVVFFACALFLKRTRIGRGISAVADSPLVAEVVGIDSQRIFLWTFAIGSLLAAPAALLFVLDKGVTPDIALHITLMSVIAVIVGGIGSVPGSLLGGILLGLAESMAVMYLQAHWQQSIAFGILLLFIIARPSGFFGKRVWSAGAP